MYPRFFKCQSVDSKLVRSRFATLSTASLVSRCLASAETARCTSWFGIKNIAAKAFARRSMSRGAQGPLAIAKCAPTSQSNNRWHSSWARVNRRPSGLQRRPCSVPVVSRWKPFLVKQWIPVVCKPLHQGKQVPVGRIRPLTILLVGAQIPTLDPQLEATPREAGVRLHRLAIIGVWSERQPQCEFAGVPGKPLPSSAHLRARSIPVRPDVTPTYALLIEPLAPEPFRHSDPPDGVPVPDVRGMLPRAVRPALSYSVPRVIAQLALSQHLLCTRCIDLLRTEGAAAPSLPGLLVLQAAFVTH